MAEDKTTSIKLQKQSTGKKKEKKKKSINLQ